MADLKAIAETLVNLTVKEVNELAGILKEEYGIVPAAAAAAPAAAAASGDAGAAEAPAQTEFNVIMTEVGGGKLNVVKVVKTITGLGLKEAKELVDKGAGAVIKENVSAEEAASIITQLEEAGAKAEKK